MENLHVTQTFREKEFMVLSFQVLKRGILTYDFIFLLFSIGQLFIFTNNLLILCVKMNWDWLLRHSLTQVCLRRIKFCVNYR